MPNFFSDGTRVFATYITGPSHILLGLHFSDTLVDTPTIVRKSAIGCCRHGESLDETRLVFAVQRGVSEVSPTLGVAEIVYVEDDTPNYSLYMRAATELAKRHLSPADPLA